MLITHKSATLTKIFKQIPDSSKQILFFFLFLIVFLFLFFFLFFLFPSLPFVSFPFPSSFVLPSLLLFLVLPLRSEKKKKAIKTSSKIKYGNLYQNRRSASQYLYVSLEALFILCMVWSDVSLMHSQLLGLFFVEKDCAMLCLIMLLVNMTQYWKLNVTVK